MGAARTTLRRERLRILASGREASGRGDRLAARMAGRRVARFGDLGAVPRWRIGEPDPALEVATALLYHRRQIDRSLDGGALRSLATQAGEALFDWVCEAPTAGLELASRETLPPAGAFPAIGASLLRRAEVEGGRWERLADAAATLIAQRR